MALARQVLFTYLLRVALLPLGLLNGAVIARFLGPSGQGVFATVGAYVATAAMFGSLGLSPAITNLVASDRRIVRSVIANARWIGAAAGILTLAALMAVYDALPGAFADITPWLLLVAGLALPFNLISAQLQAVLLGQRRVKAFNVMEAADRVMLLTAVLVLLVLLGMGVFELVAATVLIAVVKLAIYHGVLGEQGSSFRPDPAVVRRLTGISMRAYLTTLLSFLVLRSDIMLVHGLTESSETGLYSVAVQFAELLLVLPAAVGTLLFPTIAAMGDSGSAGLTAAVHRHTVVIVTGCCAVAAVAAAWIVPLLYGDPYRGATTAVLLLLPGIWCMSLQLILAADLAGRDYPVFLLLMWLVLLAVNVGLNLVLIPRFGIAGAAAASSVAYAMALFLVARYWLRRFGEVSAARLFLMDAEDWRALPGRLRNAVRFSPRGGKDART